MPRLPCLRLALLALSTLAHVQSTPPASKTADTAAIVLSPFVVDTTQDTGYSASSTLAGSRIKTDLKDVAASVSVLTTEFLDDLGAKDVASAMAFVAGAENDSTYHAEPVAGSLTTTAARANGQIPGFVPPTPACRGATAASARACS